MKWRNVRRWIPAILWMGLMVFLSRQEGLDTLQTSKRIAAIIAGILTRLGINVDLVKLNISLRKAAHVVVYFILSILVYRAFCVNRYGGDRLFRHLRSATLTIALCIVVAVLDEVQKKWIPGRHCDWYEVALNCMAVLVGTIISVLVHRLWLRRRSSVDA